MIKTCENCPKQYTTTHKRRKFCSQKCYGESRKSQQRPKCSLCDNTVTDMHNKFCSNSCARKSKITPFAKCAMCDNKVTRHRNMTCSFACGTEYRRKYQTPRAKAQARLARSKKRYILKHYHNISKQDKEAVKSFYIACPEGYHVDHIVPLSKGGSHIVKNMQYLTPTENLHKNAKFPCEILLWYLIITSGKIGQESCPI